MASKLWQVVLYRHGFFFSLFLFLFVVSCYSLYSKSSSLFPEESLDLLGL